jgi:DNA processing protein
MPPSWRFWIIAEAPFGREPQATLFPRRNRLISGLSLGAIIIEAALQSGSLITARYANDQGKEVFVVPGSPLDPRYKGSHQLLKQGATLITSSHDVMDVLDRPFGLSILSTEEAAFSPLPQADLDDKTREALTKIILSLLSPTAISLDELIRECRVSSAEILGVLLPLELAGIVVRYPGNYVARAA